MLSARLLFLLASFCSLFLDMARYACKNPTKKPLNIKQKYKPNANNLLGGVKGIKENNIGFYTFANDPVMTVIIRSKTKE